MTVLSQILQYKIVAIIRGANPADVVSIAEALYKNGSIPVKKIAEQLGISKTTLYLYLRHRNVCIGEKIEKEQKNTSGDNL